MSHEVHIYTDGAAKGNPGPAGYGVVMEMVGTPYKKEFYEGFRLSTNNRMELMAAIEGLKALVRASKVMLFTDSKYVQQGITLWIVNWRKKGWLRPNSDKIKNVDLWLELEELNAKHNVTWQWIRGHSGHKENEIVDEAARNAINKNN